MGEWIDVLAGYPWLLAIVVVAWVVRQILLTAAESNETLAKLLGPLGRRRRRNAMIEDLAEQVGYLRKRVDELVSSNLCLEAYLLYDAEWHRRAGLAAATNGTVLEPHKDYETFRVAWLEGH